MNRLQKLCLVRLLLGVLLASCLTARETDPFALNLPDNPVPDHVSIVRGIAPGQTSTYAELDGPGCIRRLWITLGRPQHTGASYNSSRDFRLFQNRKMIIRIFFDGAKVPNVEAPIGDFFGMMHGQDFYPINTPFVAVKGHNGYECYFEMPFARSARIEIANAPDAAGTVYMQVAWHRYPGQEMKEDRRFCAQWRREMPTQRYSHDYSVLDADGPGQLIGFFYGVRLIDSVDRWSHGGAENIYIDGLTTQPAYLRGIGGEDTFGTSYGGVLHTAESHLYDGIPYYVSEDTGEARSAQRLVGYRFYVQDSIRFNESLRFQFGCMENDICSTVYWYQEGAPRRNVKLPDWPKMLPSAELRSGEMDLAGPNLGSWKVGPVLDISADGQVDRAPLPKEVGVVAEVIAGFIDFNHYHRPRTRGVGTHFKKKACQAATTLECDAPGKAKLTFAWDDRLIVRVNGVDHDLGQQSAFRPKTLEVELKSGRNQISVILSNDTGSNHGGWAFSFSAVDQKGVRLTPRAESL